jgi:molecular chaperone DnaK
MEIKFRKTRKAAIQSAVDKLKEAHKAEDIAGIDTAMAELNNAWSAASQDIYNAQQAQGGQPEGGASEQGQQGEGGDGQPEDVEYEEVK